MSIRRIVPFVVALALTATACGPELSLDVGVREPAVDIIYGAPPTTVPPRPPDASFQNTTAPGFVSAPIRLDVPPVVNTRPVAPRTNVTLPPPPACPTAGPFKVPAEAAPTSVTSTPKPGIYRFRRVGSSRATAPGGTTDQLRALPQQPLSAEIAREVTNVQTQHLPNGNDLITYDVVETEPGLKTTTTYEIDPIGTGLVSTDTNRDAGVRITRIVTERSDLPGDTAPGGAASAPTRGGQGAEVFVPQPALKIIDLPLRPQPAPTTTAPQQQEHSVDPLTGTSIDLYRQTVGRARVDVCGTVIDAWQIAISDPSQQLWSQYQTQNGRRYRFSGSLTFAPQYGLIVADQFTFGGLDVGDVNQESGGRRFELMSAATINSLTPGRG
jgi:hypothetical protein